MTSINGANDLPDDHPRVMAYRALYAAAEKMGGLNYKVQLAAHLKARRSKRTFRFVVTEAHDTIVKAMPKVLGGELTPEQAMGLLWGYDVMKERGLKP